MKKWLAWIVCAVVLGAGLMAWGADSIAPPEVLKAAKDGLPAFLSKIPAGEQSEYGFDSKEGCAKESVLGKPFRLLTITPTSLDAYQLGNSVDSVLGETTLWYFPILAAGTIRSVLVVDKTAAGWEAVSLGYAPLAKALNDLNRDWPELAGFHPRLIAVFQARQFLFTIPEHASPNLTPLGVAGGPKNQDAIDYKALCDPRVTLENLIPMVNQNRAQREAQGGKRP